MGRSWLGWVALLGGCAEPYQPVPAEVPFPLSAPPASPVPQRVEQFVYSGTGQVDLLFVVDNSCSMYEEQAALAGSFYGFIGHIAESGLDFHIGVTSTDMDSAGSAAGIKGTLRSAMGHRFIDADTPNPAGVFGAMANLGNNGWYDEKGRKAAYTTIELKRDVPANQGFYRDDAALHFVFVSDEEDASNGTPTRPEFIEWMHALKASPEFTTAHGLYKIPGTTCNTADTYGAHYDAYVEATGGIKHSICNTNYAPFYEQLAQVAVDGVIVELFLGGRPWPPSLEVSATDGVHGSRSYVVCEGSAEGCEVRYDASRNSLRFVSSGGRPEDGAQVTVRYVE